MKLFITSSLALFISLTINAQIGNYFNTNGVAIKGYDPVAYFSQNEAVVGKDSITTFWSNNTWKFTSKENLNLFRQNPEKYAPCYGGFCAYGASEKHLSPTDPNAWTIVNNKLYLNYNLKVKELWIKDTTIRISNADNYWMSLNK